MRKLFIITLVFIAALPLWAQPQAHPRHAELSPEQRVELHVKKMTLALALDAQQQEKVLEIELAQMKNRIAFREQLKKRERSEEKLSSEERFVFKKQRLEAAIVHQRKLQSVFTEEQFARYQKLQGYKRKQLREKRGILKGMGK
ncbi:hypothetical protein [Croceiramulus getboli]|nr:hypothetical protein P8624_02545 [Flavobacteriaceae bacterium YJPT1-3]